jgi:cation:H+ antiporter
MHLSLSFAIGAFALSALIVAVAGTFLVQAGDQIAERRGLSRFWVGTTLLALGTSLPELVTNVASVRLDAPGLAIGNIFGANMADILILGVLALIYGTDRFFGALSQGPMVLSILAAMLLALALLAGFLPADIAIGQLGLGTGLIAALYLGGVWFLSRRRFSPSPVGIAVVEDTPLEGGEWKIWLAFGFSAAGIFAAAPLLAFSAESIAEETGLGAGFIGVALLALVTTLPEAVTSIAAIRKGSPEMVAGNLLGSCAFNIFVFFFADLAYPSGPLLSTMQGTHIAAGITALLLIVLTFWRMATAKEQGIGKLPGYGWLVGAVYLVGLGITFVFGQ